MGGYLAKVDEMFVGLDNAKSIIYALDYTKCAFGLGWKIKIITIQLIFAIIHKPYCTFSTIYEPHCIISTNFYLYVPYFQYSNKFSVLAVFKKV